MNGQEAARREEGKGEQKNACVIAPIGGLPGEVRQGEGAAADREEQHEMQTGTVPRGIKLSPQQQRNQANERERRSHDPSQKHDRAVLASFLLWPIVLFRDDRAVTA
jgi:hypothetical protein